MNELNYSVMNAPLEALENQIRERLSWRENVSMWSLRVSTDLMVHNQSKYSFCGYLQANKWGAERKSIGGRNNEASLQINQRLLSWTEGRQG